MRASRFLLNICCGVLLVFCSSSGRRGGHAIGYVETDWINLDQRYNTIHSFGASDAWTIKALGNWSQANKDKVADLLFSTDRGIGLTLWRFNIGGGTNTVSIDTPQRSPESFETGPGQYDWTRQAGEVWFARAARKRGVPYLLGFVNSPPGRMTRSGLTNSNTDLTSTTNLKPGFEEQYAKYLCDVVEHFRDLPGPDQRLVFDYLSPVNEPQNDWTKGDQEGNRCSNADIKRILIALHAELLRRHLDTRIRAVESCLLPDLWRLNAEVSAKYKAPYGNYLQEFLGDPAIAPLIDCTLCYHDYSSFAGPAVEEHHRKLGSLMAHDYPGDSLWMSETCILEPHRDLGMQTALQAAALIHADLALANVSSWQWWTAVSQVDYKDGLLYTDWQKPGDPQNILISKTFWALGNFSRFIRPGMQRVALLGEDNRFEGLLGSAYLELATGHLVLVYINRGTQPRRVQWTFNSAAQKPRSFTPYITSKNRDLQPAAVQSADTPANIPPESVVTFVGSP
jgi:O-glycosyl hydrolase